MKKFMLLAAARTGGTHVVSALHSHRDVACVSEPFSRFELLTHSAQEEWCQEFFSNRRELGRLAAGFRLKTSDIANTESFTEYIERNEILPLKLTRHNVVKQAVSRVRAVALFRVTGDYNVKGESRSLGAIRIEPNDLREQIHEIRKLERAEERFFKRLRHQHKKRLTYEELLSNEEEFFTDLYTILEVDPTHAPASRVRKNTSDRLEESITNMAELARALRFTRYSKMLTDY